MRKGLLRILFLIALFPAGMHYAHTQTLLTVYPDSIQGALNNNLAPGVFFVPKTQDAYNEFTGNGMHFQCLRTNVIESALNNTANLPACLALLGTVQADLQMLSQRCDKLIFIFEKMPAWLSSSSDGSPATTPGWYVLNTKPPANWNTWQTVVDSITDKIVNQFGISNAWFEVWNEPDIGSWTGSMSDYFRLYRTTYDGIKAAAPNAKVGGPTCNAWYNSIGWQPHSGYITNSTGDSSLTGLLLDSAVAAGRVPDFISWHSFNLAWPEYKNCEAYLQYKFAALGIPPVPLIVSEWNAPSQIRDTPLQKAYLLKSQLEMTRTGISANAIAAWQDFSQSTNEFHNDYGLLSYGAIHKPAYYSLKLSDMLQGSVCKHTSSTPTDFITAVTNDTLFVLVSNYCPPPFVEALYHTLYTGQTTAQQLDNAGFIDIAGNNLNPLDSIYRGLITLPGSNALEIAINNAIPTYQHFAAIETQPRNFQLQLFGYSGNYSGELYRIDSVTNNMQFRYDSLRTAGYTQANAITYLLNSQQLQGVPATLTGGQLNFSMQPNVVQLLRIAIPGISTVNETSEINHRLQVYPNPVTSGKTLTVQAAGIPIAGKTIHIYNSLGALCLAKTADASGRVDVSSLLPGMYSLTVSDYPEISSKFIVH
jgi:hypothetical protein